MFAVFSNDPQWARILELEGKRGGFSLATTPEKAGLWLIDLDHCPTLPPHDGDVAAIGFCAAPARLLSSRREGLTAVLPLPFSTAELQLFLHRLAAFPQKEEEIFIEDGCLMLDGNRIRLSPTERALMTCLLAHRGEIVPRATLLELMGEAQKSNALEVYVYRLRRKLEADNVTRLIAHRGEGYELL